MYPLEEIFWAARTALEAMAAPLRWSSCSTTFTGRSRRCWTSSSTSPNEASAPILIACSARGELLDERPAWGERPGAVRIALAPLSEDETLAVVGNILGPVAGLPRGLIDRITTAAEGNPLFVEQMLSMLVDRGVVRRAEDGSWMAGDEAPDVDVPPTISALIAARLERLGSEDRTVLQEGSVIGLVFYEHAVESMSPPELRPAVGPSVRKLVRRQFVRPEPAMFMDEPSFRFDHALIRDAAYRSLLKRERAELHERFAAWLEAATGGRSAELEEIVAYHLEQSARHLMELGPLDERGSGLAGRALVIPRRCREASLQPRRYAGRGQPPRAGGRPAADRAHAVAWSCSSISPSRSRTSASSSARRRA